MALVIILFTFLAGCDAAWHLHHDAPPKSQSWDQENLKAGDNTCRTMVYRVNPATKELEQCPPDSL
jgi:hypothetical protein